MPFQFKRFYWNGLKFKRSNSHHEKKKNKVYKKTELFWLIKLWINFLMGRKSRDLNRFPFELSARSQPPPRIPKGPHHVLASKFQS